MRFLIFLCMVMVSFSIARINPFEPVVSPESVVKKTPKYFEEAKVYLPNDARILKRIIFEYQTVSSDIKQKEVIINKDIDFHSPIIITHKPKGFGIIKSDFGIFKLYIKNKKIFISTKDKILRQFFLVKPFRIVIDFKRYSNFYTIVKKFNTFLKKVVVGSHGNFYRVVLYFDATYKYKINKTPEGIEIELY